MGLTSLLVGCASIRNGEPDGFQRSLVELRQKHNVESDPLIGTIPTDFSGTTATFAAVGIPAPARDEIEQRKLLGFLRASEDQICFGLTEKLEWNDYGNLRPSEEPDFIASRRKQMESGEFYVEAFDSLVEVPSRPVLPASGGKRLTVQNAVMGLEVQRWKQRVYDAEGNARMRDRSSSQKEMLYDLCGPAPELTASTRYITVAHKFRNAVMGEHYTHFLYVFERRDDGAPSLDGRGSDAANPTAAGETASQTEAGTQAELTGQVGATEPSKTAEPEITKATAVEPEDRGARSKILAVAKARLDAKARFTVKFKKPLKAKRSEKYWIAIATPSTGDADYLSYQYIEVPAAKSIELSAPDTAGEYELRLHGNYPTKKLNVVDRLKFTVK